MFDIMVLYGNTGADIISMILAFIAVSFCCFKFVDESDQSHKKRNKKRKNNRNEIPKRLHGTYVYQTDYDPRWDDDYFERRGKEPLFDDNPWDHHKK